MKTKLTALLGAVSLSALLGVAAMAPPHLAVAQEQAKDTMQRAEKNMQLVLKKLQKLGAKPVGTQSVEETRKGPIPGDAARDRGEAMPRYMVLVYPVAGINFSTPSYPENANAAPLSKSAMQWFFEQAISRPQDLQDPRLDLVGHATLDNLPSATVITAEIDPLRSEGKELADKLKAAGRDVAYENYNGVTHEFFGMATLLKDAERAQELAARDLKEALAPMATGSTSKTKKS